jgi:hypothetical protein
VREYIFWGGGGIIFLQNSQTSTFHPFNKASMKVKTPESQKHWFQIRVAKCLFYELMLNSITWKETFMTFIVEGFNFEKIK